MPRSRRARISSSMNTASSWRMLVSRNTESNRCPTGLVMPVAKRGFWRSRADRSVFPDRGRLDTNGACPALRCPWVGSGPQVLRGLTCARRFVFRRRAESATTSKAGSCATSSCTKRCVDIVLIYSGSATNKMAAATSPPHRGLGLQRGGGAGDRGTVSGLSTRLR